MAHQIDESKPKYLSQTRFMSGRRIIKTSVTEITDENVVDVLRKALATHELNRSEIDYLWCRHDNSTRTIYYSRYV